jgi:chromosome segregation ATPase
MLFKGPSLNVVVGPNGSGKSALVNGIALSLGAKTSVLGRADSLSEFICYGADIAETEIELYNSDKGGQNFVINRSWGKDNKSHWTLNGKRANGKDVQKLVDSLNIQVELSMERDAF